MRSCKIESHLRTLNPQCAMRVSEASEPTPLHPEAPKRRWLGPPALNRPIVSRGLELYRRIGLDEALIISLTVLFCKLPPLPAVSLKWLKLGGALEATRQPVWLRARRSYRDLVAFGQEVNSKALIESCFFG